MAEIEYENPEPIYEGRWNHGEYRNEQINFLNYVVDSSPKGAGAFSISESGAGMWGGNRFVVLRGPLKVAVSTADFTADLHTTEIVTVPPDKTVRISNIIDKPENKPIEGHDYNTGVAPASIPKPLRTAAITGIPSGGAGAVGGQVVAENPWVGLVTAIVGGGAGYWWENSQYAEYGTRRVE